MGSWRTWQIHVDTTRWTLLGLWTSAPECTSMTLKQLAMWWELLESVLLKYTQCFLFNHYFLHSSNKHLVYSKYIAFNFIFLVWSCPLRALNYFISTAWILLTFLFLLIEILFHRRGWELQSLHNMIRQIPNNFIQITILNMKIIMILKETKNFGLE